MADEEDPMKRFDEAFRRTFEGVLRFGENLVLVAALDYAARVSRSGLVNILFVTVALAFIARWSSAVMDPIMRAAMKARWQYRTELFAVTLVTTVSAQAATIMFVVRPLVDALVKGH